MDLLTTFFVLLAIVFLERETQTNMKNTRPISSYLCTLKILVKNWKIYESGPKFLHRIYLQIFIHLSFSKKIFLINNLHQFDSIWSCLSHDITSDTKHKRSFIAANFLKPSNLKRNTSRPLRTHRGDFSAHYAWNHVWNNHMWHQYVFRIGEHKTADENRIT